jgi:dTDP-4-dehydrorhamnose 3,5-epimerase
MVMEIRELKLKGLYEIQLTPACDERGYFMRTYDDTTFRDRGLSTAWVQENQSLSIRRGTVRGLHFQHPPHTDTKLVRVAVGAVFDVCVDLRKGSTTYGQWDSVELTAENLKCVYIPKGFAHGFCTLTERTVVLYKVDSCYAPDHQGGLRWNDETLAIPWPVEAPTLSARDSRLPYFSDFITPFL